MAVVPLTVTILAIAGCIKVRGEIWCGLVHDMEVRKEHSGERADRTQLNHPMPQRAMFVNPTLLIVLGIIGKSSEDLEEE